MSVASPRILPLGAACALLLSPFVGCSDTSGDIPTPSPEVTATPVPPTPTPGITFAEEYQTTNFSIAEENVGFDLDGDETIDNNLPKVFSELNTSLYDAIYQAILTSNGGDSAAAQLLTDQIWTALEAAGLILDTEQLNTTLNAALEAETVIYLEHLSGSPSDALLTWYDGNKNDQDQYLTDAQIGEQSGEVDLGAGTGKVGPGTFRYSLSDAVYFEVSGTLATFDYALTGSSSSLLNGVLGGAVLESEIERMLRAAIPNNPQIDEDEIVATVMATVLPYFDLTIEGQTAFSVAFTFQTIPQEISNL